MASILDIFNSPGAFFSSLGRGTIQVVNLKYPIGFWFSICLFSLFRCSEATKWEQTTRRRIRVSEDMIGSGFKFKVQNCWRSGSKFKVLRSFIIGIDKLWIALYCYSLEFLDIDL
uniref:uncharacterized protein LOC105352534 n=1 Tax=Fragaria vesca subsp. vesca TaxID=101020 RepID=UPI0005C99382|nr:PREDICTED: uncharacterized protein LOC105352534 [Fragaria vesca subsp. vesca]